MEIRKIDVLVFGLMIAVCIAVMSYDYEQEVQAQEVEVTQEQRNIVANSKTKVIRTVTKEEYELLKRVCMSEAGGKYGEPMEGKIAVVSTILNRVDMGMGTIEEVVENAYSTADNGEPDETVETAVDIALASTDKFPSNMIYFRTEHYHSFGTPYMQIGNHYFSLEEE